MLGEFSAKMSDASLPALLGPFSRENDRSYLHNGESSGLLVETQIGYTRPVDTKRRGAGRVVSLRSGLAILRCELLLFQAA
jgi:hypothetical protein